jgi:hypothetical protein
MAKVRIENTTEGPRHIHAPPKVVNGEKVGGPHAIIPPAGKDEGGKRINGFAEVDEEIISATAKDPVVQAWFDSGDLINKGSTKPAAEKKTDADKGAGK